MATYLGGHRDKPCSSSTRETAREIRDQPSHVAQILCLPCRWLSFPLLCKLIAIMSEALAATTTTTTTTPTLDAADEVELARVGGLVERLASAFEAGLDFYNTWLQRQQASNSHHTSTSTHRFHPAAARVRPIKCAVDTSLDMSSYRIQSTYQIGFTLIGPEFAAGDDRTCQTLHTNLFLLQSKIHHLCHTISSSLDPHHQPQPLPLREVYLCSEQVRLSSVSALTQQYRRMAAGRPSLPRNLPVPRPKRMSALLDDLDEADLRFMSEERPMSEGSFVTVGDGGGVERVVTAESEVPVVEVRSNPPSPPLTPKVRGVEGFWSGGCVQGSVKIGG
ncbi:hypothetical protein QC761_504107 [Podospora bellae-mahoneyi]|uniref:Uncharacterized protein n=1 Tax=Podospora bellae-mahoneyi TaxID=2093777 RepID=A0ABR0FDG7_9PEZI|nr:hypothetical protein QC761_504107 [Podospora bellae-mahoneyi]